MQNILTLITAPHNAVLTPKLANAVRDALALARGKVGPADWLDQGVACDIPFDNVAPAEAEKAARVALRGAPVDILVLKPENRRKKALVADMESTIIRNEMLDEIAFEADIGPQVAEITRRAMNGEIDFHGALRERVGLLKGQPATLLEKAGERIKLMPGAMQLLQTLKENGVYTVLVSGGFDYYTVPIAMKLGFDDQQANHMIIEDGVITGAVREPILGREAKLEALQRVAQERGISLDDCITVGDGANDLDMLRAAGLGIAFHAKPKVQEAARFNVRHGDLTALLYAQGYRRDEIVGRG
ncbi:phosphoserine phosphatase SerB [uncultured Ferrovibrio sp.]|jgi:phosphoserine phosphatase|uniref:phosphoserine phosphatase SerB n=1 Tax=uncultured Ferrovibrio sp. TaxID=1576913 RepID=UPI002637399C|nr:phosphoserine phosphatase SerB [uncultured Ferrovibrio sp.]